MKKDNLENLEKAMKDPELKELLEKSDFYTTIILICLLMETEEERQKDLEFIQRRTKEMIEERKQREVKENETN